MTTKPPTFEDLGIWPPAPSHVEWWQLHDNLIALTRFMADNGCSADNIADAVEKPWKYGEEFTEMQAVEAAEGDMAERDAASGEA